MKGPAVSAAVLLGFLLGCTTPNQAATVGATDTLPHKTPALASSRPTALALDAQEGVLFVADRGSILLVDASKRAVLGRKAVGRDLADLALSGNGCLLLAVDETAGELLVLRRKGRHLEDPVRVAVPPYPVSVRLAADGRRCTVASLWSRRLSILDLGEDGQGPPKLVRSLDLPFAPRLQTHLPGASKLVVADSFGGSLALVDLAVGEVLSVRTLPAHNIRGLAATADGMGLLVAHQVANVRGTTSRDDLHWGNLISNGVRALRMEKVLDPGGDLLDGSRLHRLGDVGQGAGDPWGLAALPGGKIVVALAGTGEVALSGARGAWLRVPTGRHPTSLVAGADGRTAYVANTFDGSVSILGLAAKIETTRIPLGPETQPTPRERGERLFHDARLSHGGWFSCHSCHTDGHTNGRLADTLQDGSHGTPKRVPTLLGIKDTAPYTWNGTTKDLAKQVRDSLETTMHTPKITPEMVADLTVYLRSLPPPPPLGRLREMADEKGIARGGKLFDRWKCAACHVPPTFTSPRTFSMDAGGERKVPLLNPPSLRGVGQSGAYFHDGRSRTLREALFRQRHGVPDGAAVEDLEDLLKFLRSL